jgi:hypothetical protein
VTRDKKLTGIRVVVARDIGPLVNLKGVEYQWRAHLAIGAALLGRGSLSVTYSKISGRCTRVPGSIDSGSYRRGDMALQALETKLQAETIAADPTAVSAPVDAALYVGHRR